MQRGRAAPRDSRQNRMVEGSAWSADPNTKVGSCGRRIRVAANDMQKMLAIRHAMV